MGIRSLLSWRSAALVSFAAACLWAADTAGLLTVNLDPAKTGVSWELAGNMHTTHGTFKLKESSIRIDLGKGTVSGYVAIDARTGESGNSTRDQRMHREIIESAKYPEIRFTFEKLDGLLTREGDSKVKITGLMELHGGKHEITVPAEVRLTSNQLSSTLRFEIPYVEWGLKDPSSFIFRVDKKVNIEVHASGTLVNSGQ
jgi:polyisoprenoid-binding protein YceI